LAKWVAPSRADEVSPEIGNVSAQAEISLIRLDVLAEYVGDDPQVQQRIVEKVLHTAEKTIAELHLAVAEEDLEQVGKLAHRIKSSARAIGAEQLVELFQLLEQAGEGGEMSEVLELEAHLDGFLHQLHSEYILINA